jgi:transketolase
MEWGIREHAMGAAVNGMALHGGLIPFGATFLVFSDYMRPALRLAALMKLHTRYVYTHDSIGLGEDGPTHQPVEHLAALRAIPNLAVIRPADANEVRECWKAAMQWDGPAALVLTRQKVPVLDRSHLASAEKAKRGAYILREAGGGGPDVILVATGSEVALALQAADQLEREGASTRVVSMPSWELFAHQDAAYRQEVLPSGLAPKVVVEAGIRQGWERWVGDDAAFVTVETFGASAPYQILFEKYGITVEHVVAEARRLLS